MSQPAPDVEELDPEDLLLDENETDPPTEEENALHAVDTLVEEALSSSVTSERYVQILHELASFIESLEIEYAETSGNSYGPFDEDMRDDYRIGLVLNSLNNHDLFFDSVLGRLVGTDQQTTPEQFSVLAASYRLLIACSVGPNNAAVSFAAEDSTVDVLLSLIKQAVSPPVRCYAVGLLSVSLLERKVADRVVRQQIPQLLLQNLVDSNVADSGHFPYDFASKNGVGGENGNVSPDTSAASTTSTTATTSSTSSPSTTATTATTSTTSTATKTTAKQPDVLFDNLGEAVSSVTIAKLMQLECNWTLQCLASMGEYQETLAPATHTGAIDTVLNIFKSDHDSIHLDTVELTWHMLAHKSFASAFVRQGGVQILLALAEQTPPSNPLNGCIALCFSGLASLSSVMEMTCRLGPMVTKKMVDHALDLTT